MSATEKTGTHTWDEQEAAIGNAKSTAALLTAIGMTSDQIAAIAGASEPSEDNVFATMDDIPTALTLGTTSDTACAGNDARLPTSDQKAALTGTSGTAPSASNKLVDNADTRMTDARTPTAHASTHASAGSDAITPAAIGAATAAQGALADTALQPTGSGASLTGITASQVGAQPSDADLTAIAALEGTAGFLKKTASDTWSLDTTVYISGNQTITLSGDVTGSGTTAITATLAASGVTAGTYGSATQSPAITVDSKGRITAVTATTIDTDAGISIITAEAITAPALVFVYNNSGTATCRNANATNANYPAVGYIKTSAASGANATVFFKEAYVTGFTGLTPGIQFLSTTNGAPTATAPSSTGNIVQEVGVAYSSTALHFRPLGYSGV